MRKHLKNGTHAVKHVGWSASLLRELKPADWRAFLGAELVVDGLPVATACAVSGANAGYVNTLLRLTPQELEAVGDGSVSLSSFHTRKRAKVVAEPVKAARERVKCSICFREYEGFGNNAAPVNNGRCCDECNALVVVPTRIRDFANGGTVALSNVAAE